MVLAIALFAAAAILYHFGNPRGGNRASARALLRETEGKIVFLFDGQDLVDASLAAQDLLSSGRGDLSEWDHLQVVLTPYFPDIRSQIATVSEAGKKRICSADTPGLELLAESWDGLVRIVLNSRDDIGAEAWIEKVRTAALESEAQTLRGIAEDSPNLIWIEDPSGAILWTNQTYATLADTLGDRIEDAKSWPPARLFDGLPDLTIETSPVTAKLPLSIPSKNETRWFDVTSSRRDGQVINFAADCTAIVRAEEAQRSFVETMGKTFAQLSVGLMIFDRQRRLMIFNPALTDLTGLPFDFLSARPVVTTVLDRLREAQMLPEPKNYASWREEIAALEIAAKNGTYCETWNLPNGSTYRVTGRPHPNGAVAFLFEDISAEVSLARHFRAELEVTSGVFDALDEAMVVFSASGSLTMSNKAYARLWHRPGTASMADSSVIEETQLWQDNCAPSPIWRDVRDFVSGFGGREAWEEIVVLNDGRHCQCRVTPLAGNATLVSFRKVHDLRGAAPAPSIAPRPRAANSA